MTDDFRRYLRENAEAVSKWPPSILLGARGQSILQTTPVPFEKALEQWEAEMEPVFRACREAEQISAEDLGTTVGLTSADSPTPSAS